MSQTKLLTNEVLKGVMSDAVLQRGRAADVDTATTSGIYTINTDSGSINAPITPMYAVMAVFADSNSVVLQLCCSMTNPSRLYYRLKWGNWLPWRSVDGTVIT